MGQNPQYDDKLIKEQITGVVIRYDAVKGFGFIKADDKNITDDIFVYFNQIKSKPNPNAQNPHDKSFLKLHQCQIVTFDLYMSRKGLVAKNVDPEEIDVDQLIYKVNK